MGCSDAAHFVVVGCYWVATLASPPRGLTSHRGDHARRIFRFELYRFRFRDRLTGKWVLAKHKLQVPELQRRYSEWQITGAPENSARPASPEQFNPFHETVPLVRRVRECSNAHARQTTEG
jgi:hypothetical protein